MVIEESIFVHEYLRQGHPEDSCSNKAWGITRVVMLELRHSEMLFKDGVKPSLREQCSDDRKYHLTLVIHSSCYHSSHTPPPGITSYHITGVRISWFNIIVMIVLSLYIKRGCLFVPLWPKKCYFRSILLNFVNFVNFAQFCAIFPFLSQSQWYFCFVKRRWNMILPRFEGAHRAHWKASYYYFWR